MNPHSHARKTRMFVAAVAAGGLVALVHLTRDPQPSRPRLATPGPVRPSADPRNAMATDPVSPAPPPRNAEGRTPPGSIDPADLSALLAEQLPKGKTREDVREECLAVLAGENPPCDKQAAVFHLANLRLLDEPVVREILRNMRAADDVRFLETAIWAVLRVKTYDVQAALIDLGSEGKPEPVRCAAVHALQYRRAPDVTSFLLARYDAEVAPEAKRSALLALAHHALRSDHAWRRLQAIATHDSDPNLSETARAELEFVERVRSQPTPR